MGACSTTAVQQGCLQDDTAIQWSSWPHLIPQTYHESLNAFASAAAAEYLEYSPQDGM